MTRPEFIAAVEREQAALRGFLLALCCGNRDDADDLAQDALVKAYLALADYREQGSFRAWLFRIAHNVFLSHRAAGRVSEDIAAVQAIAATSRADAAFDHQALYLALGTLPPKMRAAIAMFYMQGYSVREVAAITGTSEDAVKKQLSRGRDKLHELLRNQL